MHLNGSTGVLEERNIGSAWGKGHKVNFGILTVSLNRVFFICYLISLAHFAKQNGSE